MEINIVFYLLNTVIALVVGLLSLRFLLQLIQANYHNAICQSINRFTAPLIAPFQTLPTIGPINLGVLTSAILAQGLGAVICLSLLGEMPGILQIVVWSMLSVFGLMINLVFYALLGMIILSWLAPGASHPGAELIYELSEPFLAPFRKIVPDLGGLDLSPILLFILINILEATVIKGTAYSLGLSSNVAHFFIGLR